MALLVVYTLAGLIAASAPLRAQQLQTGAKTILSGTVPAWLGRAFRGPRQTGRFGRPLRPNKRARRDVPVATEEGIEWDSSMLVLKTEAYGCRRHPENIYACMERARRS